MTDHPLLVRLVDDDPDLLAAQRQSLRIAGFEVEAFDNAQDALAGLTPDYPGVVLSDVMMPGIDGLELFRRLRGIDEELPVILLTGHGDIEMAVEAMRAGAWDFLTKPVGRDALAAALVRAAKARALVLENRQLRARADRERASSGDLLGDSPAMVHLREAVSRVAQTGVDALITGAAGTGKEAVARAIHAESPRRGFVHVACDTLDEARFDQDLFGAEAGHGGNARQVRMPGRIERAHRGTLFLDRIEMLPPALQARLLHVIEAGAFWSAGATAARPLDMQVLASSRVDLGALVAEGRFHADLYYRLSAVRLHVPSLAERPEDIPVLYRHFLLEAADRLGLPAPRITPAARARLEGWDWPGNARELRQYAQGQALGISEQGSDDDIVSDQMDLNALVGRYEADLLREALQATSGNVTRAMTRLGLPRKTFYDKLARHGIKLEAFRDGARGVRS